jgi:hypothetical protein
VGCGLEVGGEVFGRVPRGQQQRQQRTLPPAGGGRLVDQAVKIEVPGTELRREELAMAHDVLAVQWDSPALRGGSDQCGARSVRGVRPLDPCGIPLVLELDADRDPVRIILGKEGRRGITQPACVKGGVLLVHELDDPSVEGDQVMGADTRSGIGEPATG